MTRFNLNFINEKATEEMRKELFVAIRHEEMAMLKQLTEDSIASLEKKLNKDDITEEETAALKKQREESEENLHKIMENLKATADTSAKVLDTMTVKNSEHLGNKESVIKNIFRVIASWDNSRLIKYALVEPFTGSGLYDALQTIHITSKCNEDGGLVLSKEVKDAYKKASSELETIVKVAFSLPFETPYTAKTRVKLTASDKKLLNDCYVKGFKNTYRVNNETGIVSFENRQVNTLVKATKNKKTGTITYNYDGLYKTVCEIVAPHYFN